MYRKTICFVFAFLMALTAAPVFGAAILAPGDFIIAIDADSASSSKQMVFLNITILL